MYINQQQHQQQPQQQRNDNNSNVASTSEDDDYDDISKRTIYCGNISEKCCEELLYELFLQAGPVESVTIVKDKDGRPRPFGFITYYHPCSASYSIRLLDGIKLFGKSIVLKPKNSNSGNSTSNSNNSSLCNSTPTTPTASNINNMIQSFLMPSTPKFHIDTDTRNRGDDRSKHFSPDNSSLRFGSSHNRIKIDDKSLEPQQTEKMGDVRLNPLNPFRNQLLSYLNSSFIYDDDKDKRNKDQHQHRHHHHHQQSNSKSGGSSSSSSNNPTKHASRNHDRPHKDNKPYNRPTESRSKKNSYQRKR